MAGRLRPPTRAQLELRNGYRRRRAREGGRDDERRATVTAPRGPWLAALAFAVLPVACSASTKHTPPTATNLGAGASLPSSTTSTTSPVRYTVARGDTLTAIARRFHVDVAAIASANHLTNTDQLNPGQVLIIPPAPPVRLVITPARGILGNVFAFSLTGAKADEIVVFEVVRPDGGKFVGPQHVAHPDGSVSTTYLTVFGDALGQYRVLAAGNEGTLAHTEFEVSAPPPATTTR
jgi:LysM repeat protein